MMKNIFKVITTLIVIILFSYLIYVKYIFYLIPYNPLNDYYNSIPYDVNSWVYIDGKNYFLDTDQYNTKYNNENIIKYLKSLSLIPLSQQKYKKELSLINSTNRIEYLIYFHDYKRLFIKDIFLDNPSIIRITSDNPRFPDGYYKIIDNEFDYDYVSKLIKGENN